MTRRKKVTDKPLSEAELARSEGVSVLSHRIMGACGMPYPWSYATVETLKQVGDYFGVSERSAAAWKSKGAPGQRGHYVLPKILDWLRGQPKGERWYTGPAKHPDRMATGDLARGILRVIRLHVHEAGLALMAELFEAIDDGAIEANDREALANALRVLFAKHFEQFRPSDEEIETTVSECWFLV